MERTKHSTEWKASDWKYTEPASRYVVNAIYMNDGDMVQHALTTTGISVQKEIWNTTGRESLLMWCVVFGSDKAADVLIHNNVDIEKQNGDGETALHGAIEYGRSEIVKILVNQNANMNTPDFNGETPLCWAVSYAANSCENTNQRETQQQILQFLLNKGADTSVRDDAGNSIINCAVWSDNANTLQMLINAGADWTATDNDGTSEEQRAIQLGSTNTAELLTALRVEAEAEAERIVAFCMGDHKRLGATSIVNSLKIETFRMVCNFTRNGCVLWA